MMLKLNPQVFGGVGRFLERGQRHSKRTVAICAGCDRGNSTQPFGDSQPASWF